MCNMSRDLRPTVQMSWLQLAVTICAVVRLTCLHLHLVPGGHASYPMRTVSGHTDRRDEYGVTRCVPIIVLLVLGRNYPGGQ